MEILKRPFADCAVQVRRADKDVAIALYNAHISTHTTNTGRNKPSKGESISRPKITQGMLTESWNTFTVLWKLYKTGTGMSEAERSLQLIYCCDGELLEQLLRADPEIMAKPEVIQLDSIKKLAVVPVAMGV